MQVAMSKYSILTIGVAVVNIGLLFAICLCFRQMDAERLEQIRARAIITESNNISKLFNDAGVAVGGYSITKSPVFADRFDKLSEQITNDLHELKELVGEGRNQQVAFSRFDATISDGMKTLAEAKSAVGDNRADVGQLRTRHMYKGLRQVAEQVQSEVKSLTAVEEGKVVSANSWFSATILFYSLLVASSILNLAQLGLAMFSSKRPKKLA